MLQDGRIVLVDGTPSTGFVFENNLTLFGGAGITGSGKQFGTTSLQFYTPGYIYLDNVAAPVASGTSSFFPIGNFYMASIEDVGFLNYDEQQYQLANNSPFKNAGTDGKDIGADISGVLTETATVASGGEGELVVFRHRMISGAAPKGRSARQSSKSHQVL